MISAKSRFIRAMKNVGRVTMTHGGEAEGACFAIYDNSDEKLHISEEGIYVESMDITIPYSDIENATCLVGDDVLLDAVMLSMKDGRAIKVRVSGHDERVYDAHSFVRFLMRTLQDRASAQREANDQS